MRRSLLLSVFILQLLTSFVDPGKGPNIPDPCTLTRYDAELVHNDAIQLALREASNDTSECRDDLFIPEKLINEYECVLKKVFCAFPDTVNSGGKNHFWESYRTDYFNYITLLIPPLDYNASGQLFLIDEPAVKVFLSNHIDSVTLQPVFFIANTRSLLYEHEDSPINYVAVQHALKKAGSRDSVGLAGNVLGTDNNIWRVLKQNGGHEVKLKLYINSNNTSGPPKLMICERTFFVAENGEVTYTGYSQDDH